MSTLPSSSFEVLELENVTDTLRKWLNNATNERYKMNLQSMIKTLERINAFVAKDTAILYSQIWQYVYTNFQKALQPIGDRHFNGLLLYIPTGFYDYKDKPLIAVANPFQDNYTEPNAIEIYVKSVEIRNKDGMTTTDDVYTINI